jgi:hypothetical protein
MKRSSVFPRCVGVVGLLIVLVDARIRARPDGAAAIKTEPKLSANSPQPHSNSDPKHENKRASEQEVRQEHGGHVFAIGMVANIVLISLVFGMTSSTMCNGLVSDYAWACVDNVILIFLAVLWFQAFDDIVSTAGVSPHGSVVGSFVHSIVLLLIGVIAAWFFRSHPILLATWCGACAHFVSFASVHSASTFQEEFFASSSVLLFVGLLVSFVVFGLISAAVIGFKRTMRMDQDEAFMEGSDDVETDFSAMALSVFFVQAVRAWINGSHHSFHGEILPEHSAFQRMCMLVFSLVMIPIGATLAVLISKLQPEAGSSSLASYILRRFFGFCNAFVSMSVAWGLIFWGQWQFEEAWFRGDGFVGSVIFAVAASCFSMAGIICLAYIGQGSRADLAKNEARLGLRSLSLLVAFAWEKSLDGAVEALAESSEHQMSMKIQLSVGLSVVVLPIYVIFFKPIAKASEERIED